LKFYDKKIALEKHGITYDDYFIQKTYHYENFRFKVTAASNAESFQIMFGSKCGLKAMNKKIFQAIIQDGIKRRKIPMS
jgi:hypothetical protein